MKRTVFLKHLPSLNNYGTGMMGLVFLQALSSRPDIIGHVEIEAPSKDILEDLTEQLPSMPFPVTMSLQERKKNTFKKLILSLRKKWEKFSTRKETSPYLSPTDSLEGKNAHVILGGDDLSEYYIRKGALVTDLFLLRDLSREEKVILLGQTIGPFRNIHNMRLARKLTDCYIFIRDQKNYQYVTEEIGLKDRTGQMSDLAFLPLPGQALLQEEGCVPGRYSLSPGNYVTCVVSGMYGAYTPDRELYLKRWREILILLLNDSRLSDKKICLLAHTLPPFDDEGELLDELFASLDKSWQSRIITISRKIPLVEARLILGSGLFTITGRMHAAVSTYQMRKPAIPLSYSVKYAGVIGMELQRSDLIIEAGSEELWATGEIIHLVQEKVNYLLNNYGRIVTEITQVLPNLEKRVNTALVETMEIIAR